MISDIFFTILYQPLYNGLVFLISIVPFNDIGLAVVILTLLVKFLLFPLTHKTTKTQAHMKTIEPEMKKIKEENKEDKQEQSRKIMELYKKHGINPFSGCFLFLIQLPIIIALYWVFWKGLINGINAEQLYSFITIPSKISMNFLGILDVSEKSFLLAGIASVSQYFQMRLAIPPVKKEEKENKERTLGDDFKKSFSLQMRYGLPIFVFFIAYSISAIVALYWATSNLFSIAHEVFVKRKIKTITEESSSEETEK